MQRKVYSARVLILYCDRARTTKDEEFLNMLLQSLIAITDNRKRIAILTLLTFAVLC